MILSKAKGFTLLELLSVVAVISILLVLVIPSWQRWLAENRVQAAVQQLYNAMQLARFTAIVQGKPVVVCANSGLQSCAQDWRQGFIVCQGLSVNTCDAKDDKVLRVFDSIASVIIEWHGFPTNQAIVFTPQGYTQIQNGRFIVTAGKGVNQVKRVLILSKTGRLRSE
jgi:type IV fimbrial biogenesis protein FimT